MATEFVSALGLDIGKRRIGVAGCDGTGLIATGLLTIERTSFQSVVEQLEALVVERQVQHLIVGLPYLMNGGLGYQAKQVKKLAKALAHQLNLPLEYVDERLTSVEAEALMKSQRQLPSRSNRGIIDRMAAALILQRWLDQRRTNLQQSHTGDSAGSRAEKSAESVPATLESFSAGNSWTDADIDSTKRA